MAESKKTNPEEILKKPQEEMSEMEKMMAEIIEKNSESEVVEEPAKVPGIRTVTPPKKKPVEYTTVAKENAKYTVTPEPKMGDSGSKKKAKARSNYRKKKKMLPVLIILAAIIAIGALILVSVINRLSRDTIDNVDAEAIAAARVTPDDGLVIPTPEPGDALYANGIVIVDENKKADSEKKEHRYEFVKEDISWTGACQKAKDAGGHLITISDRDELDEAIALTMINDCNYLWVGCHRENNELIWENGENISYYVWGAGEPSKYDSGDHVYEDYLMLWKFNGGWYYNDSRDDPCADYKDMYSGKMGYIIEYEEE